MPSIIKSHPFAVEAYFESSIVLAFAIPKEQIEHLIPDCLELDLFDNKWGFIAIAMVQTKGLRPKGLPKVFGSDFFLIGYRVFVRYKNKDGRSMRGLYILKSETDKRKMELLGNTFTHYKYEKIDISRKTEENKIQIESEKADFKVELEKSDDEIALPENSPFEDWKQARKFAGPLPYTFTFDEQSKEVLIIEGVRQNWKPKAIKVLNYKVSFIEKLNLKGVVLANSFIIENIPYHWKKGRIEKWNG